MNRSVSRILFLGLLMLATAHCGGGECETPNPNHDPSDPNSISCLDGNGLAIPGTAGENTSAESENSPADAPPTVCGGETCPTNSDCALFLCVEGQCVAEIQEGSPCEDGDACTQGDSCSSDGFCSSGAPVICEDGNPCVSSACDSESGTCVEEVLSDTSCDDGNSCTANDTCIEGLCTGTSVECPVSDNPCDSPGTCNASTGECEYTREAGAPCDDGDPCSTNDTCTLDSCEGSPLVECFYEVAPDIANCDEGVLGMERKIDAMESLNAVRAIHGLQATTYDSTFDAAVQKAAMMMTVNSDLSHTPPTNWSCWSQDGYDMAETSNLSILWRSEKAELVDPEEDIRGWLIDDNVPSLGHRRWLLDPFLSTISYGSVGGKPFYDSWDWAQSGVIKVIDGPLADLSAQNVPQIIAYPMGDYPTSFVEKGWYLSASILTDASSSWKNDGVSFSQTNISVESASKSLNVTGTLSDNNFYGLPNNIQWFVDGLEDNVEYTVTLENVLIDSVPQTFSYTFKLVPQGLNY